MGSTGELGPSGCPDGHGADGLRALDPLLHHAPRHIPTANRDRCVPVRRHASMRLYSLLHLTGYDLSLDDLKRFRHGARARPPPVVCRHRGSSHDRPARQGFANEPRNGHRGARWPRSSTAGHEIIDHWTYGICSDGDLQEGIASEAASLAGHLRLGKLVFLYDDNHIQLDGPTAMAFSEDVLARFRAYGWHTLRVKDGTDVGAIEAAIRLARSDDRPSIIAVRTVIGFGSPNKAGSQKAHGAPLGPEEVRLTKEAYGWDPDKSFFVPDAVAALFSRAIPWGESSPAAGTRRWSATGRPSRKRPRSWSGASTATCAAAGTPPSRAGRPARRSPPETPAPTRSTPLRRACRSSSAARRTSPSQT